MHKYDSNRIPILEEKYIYDLEDNWILDSRETREYDASGSLILDCLYYFDESQNGWICDKYGLEYKNDLNNGEKKELFISLMMANGLIYIKKNLVYFAVLNI